VEAGVEAAGLCVDTLGPTSLAVWAEVSRRWVTDHSLTLRCVDPAYKAVLRRRAQFQREGEAVPGGCCPEIRVSSNALGREQQEHRMAVYTWDPAARPSLNKYPVYRSNETGEVLYLYDWGVGEGINWFISSEVASTQRGVESPNLERVSDRCPEKVNRSKQPWSLFWRRRREQGWRADEGLRAECWDGARAAACCQAFRLSSGGEARVWQPDKLGDYRVNGSLAGRPFYKHSGRQNYLYFWEWGVNSGSEWMVGFLYCTLHSGVLGAGF
jgi:hypothetical protein